ncbi:MAG: holo-ACP synthase [Nitrospinota bacterium]|nr:holo-ACP synthase [Nitrospinota bacterium]MEC8957867.1 holo-ACP synthase [Nitrospinota bacterium]MEC9423943.1 holo-ACP synthase [Nitrospinota bacterium]MED5353488.1 holo-ACP synthase [Nitrospinota bacterium]MEE3253804.1 holo-ACP synthase [Nitrospinota bacterium]
MIFGTGLDVIELDRIKNSIEKYSPKFEQRVFTSSEISYCKSQGDPVKHFAARFAVKEAVSKCLGTGITGALGFQDMEVTHKDTGQPVLKMLGKGKKLFQKLKLKAIHISISHDRTHAIAHAIAEQ